MTSYQSPPTSSSSTPATSPQDITAELQRGPPTYQVDDTGPDGLARQ